ncbi:MULTISPECIES: ATP-binding protein [unclassified Leptolyngbya]|uniref:ATP-binding response regulator n=1 Tax=unclassified Leptolyngbya TaxID=2650499 RepID=UPI001683C657|nr:MULTISPECIES: ATP-binding protein [unclassified Leptolyngbya]MBD1913231.1 response regulator [Leptolyngbya sp. FACHB-8]MBD2153379.1 response regulator [Leptolyngbya sp. FACHB-16]
MTIPETPNPSETTFWGDSEMAAFMRSYDWSTTPLGAVETWSPSLRTLVSTMLPSRFAQSIFWGEDYIQLYNDAVIPIYGANHPKALGQPARETWAEIWHDQVKPMFESVRTTGEVFFAVDQLFHPMRFGYLEETYFTLCYSPVRDETGQVSGMLCTSTETTQQVIGQRRLTMLRELAVAVSGAKTRSSAYLTAAAALNPYDIPFALFYQVNGNLAERVAFSGLSADSAIAPEEINLTEQSDSWSLMEVFQSRESLLITDVVDRFGAFPVEPWGESPRSAFILPILSSNKEAVEGLLVAGISPRLEFNADYRAFLGLVAQQVESAIAIARSYEEDHKRAEALAELDRAKTTFFSNVSHGFRTPLTLMLAPLEDALATLAERADLKEPLQVVHRNGLRLLKLVNMLLDFSRMESAYPEGGTASHRISSSYQPTDLATFTAELASVFRSAIERANLRLVVDCPPLPEPVYVDREMWEKIVLNLLSNAFKFTFTGEIAVRLHLAGEQVELSVEDTGIGIPASEIPRLFERFYQVKGSQGRTIEGSGIGLSLVQEWVKLQGGTVQVSSIEGQGTCFKVAIPTRYAHLPPDRVGASPSAPVTSMGASPYVEEALWWLPETDEIIKPSADPAERSQSFSPSYSHTASSPSNRVLLMDDNADMRDYVKRLLSQRWQVETAANGAIALNLIQQQLPDLVLTDVMMPEVDGFQLLKALRADPITKSIPIILLSARAGEEATVEGLEAGADDYLIKPFSARELMARVETQLQMTRLRQELAANRFKNEFLMTVTHELQSPLATILGWARFLQTKPLDPETTARALATIERNATIEAKLIKGLLDVASILSGKLRLKSQVVDLASLTQNVTTTFREVAQAKRIQLVEKISKKLRGDIFADGDRLKQVITNLLENAIKFTPEGGQVIIQLERRKSGVQIMVSDTGIGIHPDFLPYVFDRFTQAEVPSRQTPGGVGIGLAIARHLVELHHGTIEVDSAGEGQGATFTVWLPLAQ